MDGGDNILDSILDEGNVDDFEDIEMLDVEEGELVEESSKPQLGETSIIDSDNIKQGSGSKNPSQKKKKRKNKRKRGGGGGAGPKVMDVNRFVIDVCRRLKEKKSYLIYTAVACLGVGALNDLVKEVYAIEACGGQKTSDGKRYRNGGGILWNILKTRDPNAYKEIMTRGKEFEKQFKQPNNKIETVGTLGNQEPKSAATNVENEGERSNDVEKCSDETDMLKLDVLEKRVSVHDRIRVPVTYSDIVEGGDLSEV